MIRLISIVYIIAAAYLPAMGSDRPVELDGTKELTKNIAVLSIEKQEFKNNNVTTKNLPKNKLKQLLKDCCVVEKQADSLLTSIEETDIVFLTSVNGTAKVVLKEGKQKVEIIKHTINICSPMYSEKYEQLIQKKCFEHIFNLKNKASEVVPLHKWREYKVFVLHEKILFQFPKNLLFSPIESGDTYNVYIPMTKRSECKLKDVLEKGVKCHGKIKLDKKIIALCCIEGIGSVYRFPEEVVII